MYIENSDLSGAYENVIDYVAVPIWAYPEEPDSRRRLVVIHHAPANTATNPPTTLTLSWGVSSSATSYEYCYDTTNDDNCSGAWVRTGMSKSATIRGLSQMTVYYWQVRAINSFDTTYANGGAWWRFTTAP